MNTYFPFQLPLSIISLKKLFSSPWVCEFSCLGEWHWHCIYACKLLSTFSKIQICRDYCYHCPINVRMQYQHINAGQQWCNERCSAQKPSVLKKQSKQHINRYFLECKWYRKGQFYRPCWDNSLITPPASAVPPTSIPSLWLLISPSHWFCKGKSLSICTLSRLMCKTVHIKISVVKTWTRWNQ